MSDANYDPSCLPDLLPIYYKKLFPYGPYFRWLNYGGVPKNYFANREFSFTLKDDVYIRYQSFSDQQDLEKEIQKRCPYKIDIGAIFTHRPKDHKTIKAAAFQAQEKELVFDIDMTDYDDVRYCCSGADICSKCWPLMQIAIKIVDRALRDDFGFEHLLWVYSGRRGVHCWVCDEVARKLSQMGRSAIAEYLSVVKGGENQTKKVSLDDRVHPSIRKFTVDAQPLNDKRIVPVCNDRCKPEEQIRCAIDIVKKFFTDYALKKQDILGTEERSTKVLQLVPDEIREELEKFVEEFETSKQKWLVLEKKEEEARNQGQYKKSQNITEEIMLQYCYPRLDVNVSKGVNHLLKSPFCIHPKTGRVCVPIDPETIEKFNPFDVPTVSTIIEELNQSETTDEQGRKVKDYKRTSLKTSVQVFETFLSGLEKTWKGKLLEQSDLKKEF